MSSKKEEMENPSPEESGSAALAEECASLVLEKKGRDVVIMDVATLTDVARNFVICSCDNDVHVRAVAEHIREQLAERGLRPWRTEGWKGLNWIIMDYVDVVVHIFYRETREFYKLERLWADAEITVVHDEAEQKDDKTIEKE